MASEPVKRARGRIAVLLLLAAVAVAIWGAVAMHAISPSWLMTQRQALRDAVAAHEVAAPLGFVAFYAATVACAVPSGVVLGIAAGLLFGTVQGGVYATIAVTLGSAALFFAVRSTLRPVAERWLRRRNARFPATQDRFATLLAFRLMPFAPFSLVSIGAGLTRIDPRAFVVATALGTAPMTFILAASGASVGETLDASLLLRPAAMVPLLLCALTSLAPLAIRRWRRRRRPAAVAASASSPAT